MVSDALAGNPQTLLFSATLPHWVHETAKKHLKGDVKHVDLVGSQTLKTSTTVQVNSLLFTILMLWLFN